MADGNRGLTAVAGLAVGHAEDREAATGCTVVLGPFTAGVEVIGLATGTRELDALSPLHLVPSCDALLLTGGSAFGLGAADGVVAWLEERGRGFPTPAARVPIVPTAVIYDLAVGRADVRPGPAMGRAAAAAASGWPVPEGRVGAGAGATVGKLLGPASAAPGGVGSWAEEAHGVTVGALAVVNAFGDVLDERGEILAGARNGDGRFVDTARALRERPRGQALHVVPAPGGGGNTTLGVVATDFPLSKGELQMMARQASRALARRISPVGTPFDGDLVFALSTARGEPAPASPDVATLDLLSLFLRAQAVLERAIERAVTAGAEVVP